MTMTLEEIEREIQRLEASEKAEISKLLITGLDKGCDEDVERAWLEEAQRRYLEMKEGKLSAVPANEVFSRARDWLNHATRTLSRSFY